MSIREQIEDVRFLMEAGRFKGALTMLMSAIAASARKSLPKKTKSITRPAEDMGDGEAFKYFLGGRLCRLLAGDVLSSEFGFSGFCFTYRGVDHPIEHILYKFYRCELLHEGDLPEDVVFLPEKDMPAPGSTKLEISYKKELILTYPWLVILIRSVVEAKCNAGEFGIDHFDIVVRPGCSEDEAIERFQKDYGISVGRFHILKTIVFLSRDYDSTLLSDECIQIRLATILESKRLHRGHMSGLSTVNIVDDENTFTDYGLSRFREVAALYFVQKI